MPRFSALLFAFLSLLAFAGCGGGASYPSAKISGTVTLDGQPLKTGSIGFIPLSKGQGREDGGKIENGKYSLKNVPLGKVKVYITSTKETGRMIPGSSEQVAEVVSIVPAKYSQGIDLEISGDNDALPIELTSQ